MKSCNINKVKIINYKLKLNRFNNLCLNFNTLNNYKKLKVIYKPKNKIITDYQNI